MTAQESIEKIRENWPIIKELSGEARGFIEGYLKRCEDEKREAEKADKSA